MSKRNRLRSIRREMRNALRTARKTQRMLAFVYFSILEAKYERLTK